MHEPQLAISMVWDYFGLKINESDTIKVTAEQKPVYQTCHKSVVAIISNLMAH